MRNKRNRTFALRQAESFKYKKSKSKESALAACSDSFANLHANRRPHPEDLLPSPVFAAPPRRLIILALLFGLSFASYVERVNISVAAELMMPALSLSKSEMALIFNSFLFGYALFQVPVGALGDRYGARRVLGFSALLWAALTVATGFLPGLVARSAAGILALLWGIRFLLGVAEASTYPVAARAVHQWMPASRRGAASSVMLMGSSVGSALTAPVVAWSMVRFGWRTAFYLTAVVALVVALLWFIVTRNVPSAPPELETIAESALVPAAPDSPAPWFNGNVALLSLSYLAEGYLLFTFVYWLYIYLVEVRGFSLATGGLVTSLPWIAAIAATPLGGVLSDFFAARVGRIRSAQILIMTGYSLSGTLLLVAAAVPGRAAAVLALSVSLACMYLAESSFWTTATTIAGDSSSRVAGLMNTVGVCGGILSNTLTPMLVHRFGHTGWLLAFSGGTSVGLLTAMLWWILAHRLEPRHKVVSL